MVESAPLGPVAVENPPARAVGIRNELPPATSPNDPALAGFAKIQAEHRTRKANQLGPMTVPFGEQTIRIWPTMSAAFVDDISRAEMNPSAALSAIRSAIIPEDLDRFDEIMHLPMNNHDGIDGAYLLAFLGMLGEFYGGAPLGG